MTDLRVSQVCVPSKQDGDIICCLSHPLHHHSQLLHPLLSMALTALKVGRHQTKLLAFEIHLMLGEENVKFTSCSGELNLTI